MVMGRKVVLRGNEKYPEAGNVRELSRRYE
jgi:hypothetical protein